MPPPRSLPLFHRLLHACRSNPIRVPPIIRRRITTQTPPLPPKDPQSRLVRLNARLPRFLHRYTTPLLTAPITHISSFLLLHELTAVVPLFALVGFFHYTQWLPPFVAEGKWVAEGVELFGRWFRRRGWIKDERLGEDGKKGRFGKWWGRGEGGVRIVIEFATAWAIIKAILPVRLVFSVWATPWFARIAISPLVNIFRSKKAVATGTGVIGAGMVAKDAPATAGSLKRTLDVGKGMEAGVKGQDPP